MGGDQVLGDADLVGLLGAEQTVLDQAHQDAAREVLVGLDDVHVSGTDRGHVVEPGRHGLEV